MTDTQTSVVDEADRALKAKHRAMWASGDYPALASDLIWSLGPRLVDAVGVQAGDRVLDVAAGSGNAAIPAALRGATVVASDLTPELFDAGRRRAREAGAELEWREADAEALPFPDDAFDAVVSSVGVMFAPHHERSATEILRVTRPGGRIGVLSWTPQGFVGRMFATMKPFNAPPPPGAQPAPLWGDDAHVRELFGASVTDFSAVRETVTIDRFDAGGRFREYFASHYGPTIAVYRRIADDPAQVAALDAALDALADAAIVDGRMQWEYLLVTATVR
ncbi:methyltransferase domain-containing protein [Microbacterium sp. dk485]|uniref:class I SAM-dependent methyltransferase n=1 Tax=Microbacterium TaxID=33882 RepID=UPI0010734035|nr:MULTISPECIES: methyltransferase domain-containing protein [Microbacterium]TFV84929.1 methyltransferase domain-containing protein [Microbacterium sp. dk485]TXK11724.1 methyltransferase domain-containing protein [Microbacterium wangchenii]